MYTYRYYILTGYGWTMWDETMGRTDIIRLIWFK